jgi:hypothetical protein
MSVNLTVSRRSKQEQPAEFDQLTLFGVGSMWHEWSIPQRHATQTSTAGQLGVTVRVALSERSDAAEPGGFGF